MRPEAISRFKKERFLKGMSEDEFRDRVVRPLFLRLGFQDGRDLCGPFEHGRDAIFVETDRLGKLVVTAVQTKRGNLNLASKASDNLISAVTQLQTALEAPIIILSDKRRINPSQAILCASGIINEHARNYIIDSVKNTHIAFLDIEDLIPKIDENFAELWLGIDAELVPYFRAIEKYISGRDSNIEDGHDGVLGAAADDAAFVSLNLFRNYSKKRKVRGQIIDVPAFEEFPLTALSAKKPRRLMIVGEAGSGKTTGLLRIALEAARRGIGEDSAYLIPVIVKATEFVKSNPVDVVDYLDQSAKSISGISSACFTDDDLSEGRVIVLVDGLDELANDAERRALICKLDSFWELHPKCQIVIASRPYRFIQTIPEMSSYEQFSVSPISWRQAEKIITTVTSHKRVSKAVTNELMRKLENIHGVELNPLLVTVFAATTDFAKHDIPANITELFKKYTELMLGRWDERKGFKQQHQAPLKDFLICKIAFEMHRNRTTNITRSNAEGIASAELKLRGYQADAGDLLAEIFDRSGLFRVMDGQVEFRHHLLQEFFAGRGLESPEVVKSVVGDDWWRRALVFYFGDNPKEIDLLRSAIDAVSGVDAQRMYEAAATIGLSIQACYLSPVADKIDIWKWVAGTFSEVQDQCLEKGELAEKYPAVAFAYYYLCARDSVALSHLKSNMESILDWVNDVGLPVSKGSRERKLFWLMAGLIESGDVAEARRVLADRNLGITDGRLLAAIHLGCHLAHEVRPLPDSDKEIAGDVCRTLDTKIGGFREQLMKEYGSLLLEFKKGSVAVIDDKK